MIIANYVDAGIDYTIKPGLHTSGIHGLMASSTHLQRNKSFTTLYHFALLNAITTTSTHNPGICLIFYSIFKSTRTKKNKTSGIWMKSKANKNEIKQWITLLKRKYDQNAWLKIRPV